MKTFKEILTRSGTARHSPESPQNGYAFFKANSFFYFFSKWVSTSYTYRKNVLTLVFKLLGFHKLNLILSKVKIMLGWGFKRYFKMCIKDASTSLYLIYIISQIWCSMMHLFTFLKISLVRPVNLRVFYQPVWFVENVNVLDIRQTFQW